MQQGLRTARWRSGVLLLPIGLVAALVASTFVTVAATDVRPAAADDVDGAVPKTLTGIVAPETLTGTVIYEQERWTDHENIVESHDLLRVNLGIKVSNPIGGVSYYEGESSASYTWEGEEHLEAECQRNHTYAGGGSAPPFDDWEMEVGDTIIGPGAFIDLRFLGTNTTTEGPPGNPDYSPSCTPEEPEVSTQVVDVFCLGTVSQNQNGGVQVNFDWEQIVGTPGTNGLRRTCSGVLTGSANGTPPVANFTSAPAGTGANDIAFTSTSTDAEDLPEELHYLWDFGHGGETSTEQNPKHTFPGPGIYQVTLTVTDTDGRTASRTIAVRVGGTVVNSTGDAPATDAAATGCDTGGEIDGKPECTLRAAIETANEEGGGEITFDIAGTPSIVPGTRLPDVEHATIIDGTTQEGGWVEVSGASLPPSTPADVVGVLTLAGDASTVRGLVLNDLENGCAVWVKAGTDHRIEANRLGTDAGGTTSRVLGCGVGTQSPGTIVHDNLMGGRAESDNGVVEHVIAIAGATNLRVEGNRLGVTDDGSAVLGAGGSSVTSEGAPGLTVTDNVMHAQLVGVFVTGASASDAVISGNTIGLSDQDHEAGEGVRIDGSPGAEITANTIVPGTHAGVLLSGSDQTSTGTEGERQLRDPDDDVLDTPVTGGNAVVSGNAIGLTPSSDDRVADSGIIVWADANDVSVAGNTIGSPHAIDVRGGTGQVVAGNTVTRLSADSPLAAPESGIKIGEGTPDVLVGANDVSATGTGITVAANDRPTVRGNTVDDAWTGIEVGQANGPVVDANTITGADEGIVLAQPLTASLRGNAIESATVGIEIDEGSEPSVEGNTFTGQGVGLSLNDTDGATVRSNDVTIEGLGVELNGTSSAAVEDNTFTDTSFGVDIGAGAGAVTVSDNRFTGGEQAIRSAAEDTQITGNRIGQLTSGGLVAGPSGVGILIAGGPATVRNNWVVGAGGSAIVVGPDAVVTLRGNRLEDIEQRPIVAPAGPDRPTIDAAIASTATDGSTRTTLVISGLPEGDAGELEVFANDDCDPDGEAAVVLGVVKTKKLDRTTMIVQLIDRDDDNFTVTYTDSAGSTSELSECEPIGDYPDSDGDGSVDPIDDLTGGAGDPARGVLITDDEQVLEVSTDSGRLVGLSAVDDPAPGGHAGVDLPYGTVRFSVEGLPPGGTADVTFVVIDGDAMQPTSTYWKFGSPSPGAPPSWFDFSYDDDDTGLGAQTLDPIDVGDLGFRRPLQISFRDGALGDADGFPNGTVVDPGAVAVPNGNEPDDPDPEVPGGGGEGPTNTPGGSDPVSTPDVLAPPSGNEPDDPDPEVPGGGGEGPTNTPGRSDPVSTPDVLAPPSGNASDTTPDTLPRTGAPIIALLVLGAFLPALGTALRRAAITMGPRKHARTTR